MTRALLNLMLLHSLQPEFFSLGVHIQDLPIRKSHRGRRPNHVRFARIGGNAKIGTIRPGWVDIHVMPERPVLERQFFGNRRPQA